MKKKKKTLLKAAGVILIAGSVILLFCYITNGVIDISNLNGDADDIREYLSGFGFGGAAVLTVLYALIMVFAFVPSEFIQLTASITYPFYIVFPICILGIFLGSGIIYALVNVLGFKLTYLEKYGRKIEKIVKKINTNTSIALITYILFIMPAIPIGAICYFAATSKLDYKNYTLVCMTGVLPSVCFSVVVGNTMLDYFNKGALQFVLAVSAVVLVLLIFVAVLLYIIKRVFMSDKKFPKPEALPYYLLYSVVVPFLSIKYRISHGRKIAPKIKGPAFVIAPHTSFYDFVSIAAVLFPHRPTFVINRYYLSVPIFRFFINIFHMIPKSLFYPDTETIRKIYMAKENKNIIVMFPEGRLSSTGESFLPASGTERLIKKLGVPVYRVVCHGAYLSKPKWAKVRRRGKIQTEFSLLADEKAICDMSVDEIADMVHCALDYNDESAEHLSDFRCRDYAAGLSNVLWLCPDCGGVFTLHEEKNALVCGCCGKRYELENFRFKNVPLTVSEWNGLQKRYL